MSARELPVEHLAGRYAAALLRDLDCAPPSGVVAAVAEHPARSAARCGLTALSGAPEAPPRPCPAPLAAAADGALAALATLAPDGTFDTLRGSALLTERAACFGHRRQGRQSAGGSCRLLDASDGSLALNLAREDDWPLLAAWLECEAPPADWEAVQAACRGHRRETLIERARLLGLAAAADEVPPPAPWCETLAGRAGGERVRRRRPRVLDLSSLWAGPLCTHLLQRCGADVVKLESRHRPDGARRGPAPFFDLMNAGKRSVSLDFSTSEGRAQLRALVEAADIVVEASRPRALRQLGIDAEALVRTRPDFTWISLTGYGRRDPQAQWIAYGDDAGVAAGLTALMRIAHGEACFVGDAIADPLAGLHAALAAWASHRRGGSRLISIALTGVVRHVVGFEAPGDEAGWRERARQWQARVPPAEVAEPAARAPGGIAPALGADTAAVLAEWESAAC